MLEYLLLLSIYIHKQLLLIFMYAAQRWELINNTIECFTYGIYKVTCI